MVAFMQFAIIATFYSRAATKHTTANIRFRI